MHKAIITLALLLSLATPVAADTVQILRTDVGTIIINHTKNTTDYIYGDTGDADVVIITKEED